MAGIGMKYVAFLITLHTLFYYAGAAGMVTHQSGLNEHKQFVTSFKDNATSQVSVDSDPSTFDQISLAVKAIPGIGFLYKILSAPYSFLAGTGLPQMYVLLGQALLGFMDFAVIISFIRGKDL